MNISCVEYFYEFVQESTTQRFLFVFFFCLVFLLLKIDQHFKGMKLCQHFSINTFKEILSVFTFR